LADLRGKKVRVFNNTLTDFVEGAGGTTVTIPFADVVPALQRGVADCAITGTFNGNIANWPEVAGHILGVSLGWAVQYAAVNLDAWNKLNPETQQFLQEQFLELEKDSWTRVAVRTTAEGVTCNTGGECALGKAADIEFIDPTPEDEAERLRIMREAVVPRWAERCGADCAAQWNDGRPSRRSRGAFQLVQPRGQAAGEGRWLDGSSSARLAGVRPTGSPPEVLPTGLPLGGLVWRVSVHRQLVAGHGGDRPPEGFQFIDRRGG
jgi:hypothetical protein